MPVSVYYPPDWAVDESEISTLGRVKFLSPARNPALWITAAPVPTTTPIDALRDLQATALAGSCARSGIDATSRETVSGTVFDELLMACDLEARGQIGVFLAVGLSDGYVWSITATSPRKEFDRSTCDCTAGNVEHFFAAMLDTLNIYDTPAAS